jgi:aspartyl-tRNA(Asn)/glutamyl-tRNA(Gln) amidotransferase subunit A
MSLQLFPAPEETIYSISTEICTGRRTCYDVVQQCFARIGEWEPRVHAWVSLDQEGALALAKERDREIARGQWRGALHGIPLGIKDIIDLAGLPTACGSTLLAQTIAAKDAALVGRLRAAGAIFIGKTVTTQFACFDPPVTRNPWNLEHTPGGSSSGSAAAVATGMCLGAIGSQTGGSITRPAAFCGVAGCKPTFGRVSVDGVYPLAPSLDHPGPLARCVRDLGLLLEVIADPAAGSSEAPHEFPLRNAFVRPLSAPRLGRLGGLFDERVSPSGGIALQAALQELAAAGARIAEARLPASFGSVLQEHRTVMTYEMATLQAGRLAEHPEDYLPAIRGMIEEGRGVSESAYSRGREHQAQLRREMRASFEGVDALVCPSAVGSAPDISTTGDPAFNAPWSYTGLPTVTVPIRLDPVGLPLGLQLVGRPWDEAILLRTAAWCEGVLSRMTS